MKPRKDTLFPRASYASTVPTQLWIKPHYMPCTAYLSHVCRHEALQLEVCAFYEKQTYQNRCYIGTSQGVERLVVPVQHVGRKRVFKDAKIDYSMPWPTKHMRALATAYGSAPYYHALADLLFPILERKPAFLLDLNVPILAGMLRFIGWSPRVTLTEMYMVTGAAGTVDMRDMIHPKRSSYATERVPMYRHLFGSVRRPNLSGVDLLFCEGPQARVLLEQVDHAR